MKIMENYSHLYGEEYLVIRKSHLYEEIKYTVSAICSQMLRGQNYIERWYSFGDRFRSQLTNNGWVNGLIRNVETTRTSSSTLLLKGGIGVTSAARPKSTIKVDLFAVYPWLYASNMIDVGIVITPFEKLGRSLKGKPTQHRNMTYFEELIGDLKRQPRNTPTVPLLVLGVAQ